MSKSDVFISVVAVIHDDTDAVAPFIGEVKDVLSPCYENFEILLIENGVRAPTHKGVRELLTRERSIRFIGLTKSADYETAVIAGLDASIGDFVVIMDPEFDPPTEIPAMVDLCHLCGDVVLGVYDPPRRIGLIFSLFREGFFRMASRLNLVGLIRETTGFRVLSRQAVNALTRIRNHRRYFPLLAAEIGLRTATHPSRRISRLGRQRKDHLLQAVQRGMSMVVYNSVLPLRLVSVLGLLGSLLSFLYSFYVIAVFLVKRDVMPGWTTLSLELSGLFFLMFIIMILLSEYVGRLMEESSDRPLYHVREEISGSPLLFDAERRNVLDHSAE